MAWFKVDDKLHDHPKPALAGKAAMGVWVLAGSWSADNLMDGFVPVRVLGRWGTRTDANKLVQAGMWDDAIVGGEPGWQFHDWDKFQPMRSAVEDRRARNARKLADWRARKDAEDGH